jgi:hypothetical protein
VLRSVHKELESSAAKAEQLLEELPKDSYPYPGYDLTGWSLVSQEGIFITLAGDTIEALTFAYNRMRTANEQLAFVADMNHGQTSLLIAAAVAPHIAESEVVAALYSDFQEHRKRTRELLIERVMDLKGFIDKAIDSVEGELELESSLPAVQRRYVSGATCHTPRPTHGSWNKRRSRCYVCPGRA